MKKEVLIEIVTSALNETLCDGCKNTLSPYAYESCKGGSCDLCRSKAGEEVVAIINAQPSAQPERPKGHWIDTGSGQECSECGEIQYGYDNFRYYCAKCGSDNRGK